MPLRTAQVGDTVRYRDADGYFQNVYVRGFAGSAPTAPSGTPGTGGTLANSTTFGHRLTAIVDGVETVASAEVQTATGLAENAVTLDWSATPVAGATAYRIYGRTAGGPWGRLADVSGAATSYVDDGSDTPDGALTAPTDTGAVAFVGPHDNVTRLVSKATSMKQTNRYFHRW